jgi:riboflavin synthase
VQSVQPAGLSRVYRLGFPQEFGIQVVDKGSVTLDGISLTVNHCGPDFLEVNIIPETQKVTTIAHWKPGTRVNMETDIIGKYVQRMLTPWSSSDNGLSARTRLLTVKRRKPPAARPPEDTATYREVPRYAYVHGRRGH